METTRICKECRQPLPADAPEGLCPACLARVALGTELAAAAGSRGKSGEPAETLTISPDAFVRVRYFGDYELQEEIARGGMGVVWKARQSSLNRTIALKMILAGKLAGEAEVQRFRREAEAAANLQHPNIVAIHEVGEHDGQHYYSMDYIAGRDLGALVRESGPLPPARAAECLKTIAEAVHFAHQRGTLHRDLKPQNVLMDAAGVPRITDFGLAKFIERDDSLTQSGAAMGSPSYMPPEQAAGHLDQVGPHSDVYALGAILYELLTGRPPFRAETAMATMRQVMESDPVAPRKVNAAVPPDLETICLKCLEKNPVRRYPSARALADELARFLKHEPIQSLPVSAVRKTENWLRRNPWTLLAVGSLLVLILTGLLYWQYERVKFLQNAPPVTNQAFLRSSVQGQQLETWNNVADLVEITICLTFVLFLMKERGLTNLRQLFDRTSVWAPSRQVGQRLRVVCGLMSVAALGFTALYFAKLIRFGVWEKSPHWGLWLNVYLCLYFSALLLFKVVRDYQKFVHGLPSRTLSSEENESLRQTILDDGGILRAIKLYRRTAPDASLDEAKDYVGKLASELKAKHPEKFASPKLWELNWRAMGMCLIVEAVLLAVVWGLKMRSMPAGHRGEMLLILAVGFMFGAGAVWSLRLKNALKRTFVLFGIVLSLLPALALAFSFSYAALYFFPGGLAFGGFVIVSGFTPKRRKSTPDKHPFRWD